MHHAVCLCQAVVAVVFSFFLSSPYTRDVGNLEVPEPPDELCASDWVMLFWGVNWACFGDREKEAL